MITKYSDYNKTLVGIMISDKVIMACKVKNGKIQKNTSKPISDEWSKEEVELNIISAIDLVCDDDVTGIGVGVPCFIKSAECKFYKLLINDQRKLQGIIETRFSLNVKINNIRNCFALGEKFFGSAMNYSNVVGVNIDKSINCGIILNDKVYGGSNAIAGDFGSIPFLENNVKYYCREEYFIEKYGCSFDVLLNKATNNDKEAIAIFDKYGIDLGNVIHLIRLMLAPEIIVLGGTIAKAFEYFKKAMWLSVENYKNCHKISTPKIEVSRVENVELLGAIAPFIEAV